MGSRNEGRWGENSRCACGIQPLFVEAIMLFAHMISIWPKNNIRQVRNWKKKKEAKLSDDIMLHA